MSERKKLKMVAYQSLNDDKMEDKTGTVGLVQCFQVNKYEEVERAIADLPPLQREALLLFEYEELSLAEIAAVVGADSGAVKGRLFRAREKLRIRLDRYFRIGREAVTVKRA